MSLAASSDTQPPSDNIHISIPLGIFIGLLASFIQSLGLTIQRKSHVINQSLPKHSQRVEHRRPLWLLGFIIFILSNLIGSLVQIASLPVVILAPLGAVSLLWNAFFARFILGDVFSPWMILGTILIAGGAVLIAIFGIVPEPTHSLADLLVLFRRPAFVVYFSLLGMAVFACLAVTHIGEYSWFRKGSKGHSPSPPPTTTTYDIHTHTPELNNTAITMSDDSTLTERTPLLDRKKGRSHSSLSSTCNTDHSLLGPVDRTPILLAISYASISGIISGMCLIFAKSGVELLLLTIGGQNQFRHWESWVLILGLIAFALLQLWYLHKALILANPTLVCPSAFCFYNLSSIVNGLIYFDQLQLIKPLYLCLVALGIVILLGGVWVVSIQSGGGGIDVGTWNEEEQSVHDGGAGAGTNVLDQEDVPPLESWGHRPSLVSVDVDRTPGFGPVPMERETMSEPCTNLPRSPNAPPCIGTSSSQPLLTRPHRHSIHLSGAPRSPPPFRTRFSHRQMTIGSGVRRVSTSSHQRNGSHPPNMFSPPLNNTVSTLGTGLQIGLSPISPGFIIVPRERRRGLSSLGNSDMEEGSQSYERRTVSEGDVRAPLGAYVSSPASDGEAVAEPTSENLGQGLSRKRWKWLRNIFLTRS